ncbi:Rv1733c family protein [Streptomyces siamensis]|uniref:Membrane protein SCJ1.26 n=1 Tax=Streptomyces siamensis TaxID=1274986 RepID=A0ABP9JFH8_9ACTN
MRKEGHTKVRGWRWRRNPLRRHSDVVEARIVLAAWAAAIVGGAVGGAVVAQAVAGAVEHDRMGRRPVSAVMVSDAPSGTRDVTTGVKYDHVTAKVRWTDSHGVLRTDQTTVKGGSTAGATVAAWTDGRGHLVSGPIGSAEAAARVGLAGAGAGLTGGLLVLTGGLMVRLRIERRATEQWGIEWDQVGPQWGRKTS